MGRPTKLDAARTRAAVCSGELYVSTYGDIADNGRAGLFVTGMDEVRTIEG
jgi:hypothetical protein